jgi:hypothetical protein
MELKKIVLGFPQNANGFKREGRPAPIRFSQTENVSHFHYFLVPVEVLC